MHVAASGVSAPPRRRCFPMRFESLVCALMVLALVPVQAGAEAPNAENGDLTDSCTNIFPLGNDCTVRCRGGEHVEVVMSAGILGSATISCGFSAAQCTASLALGCSDHAGRNAEFADTRPCHVDGFGVGTVTCNVYR